MDGLRLLLIGVTLSSVVCSPEAVHNRRSWLELPRCARNDNFNLLLFLEAVIRSISITQCRRDEVNKKEDRTVGRNSKENLGFFGNVPI
jgi:hypothetical protein